MQGGHGGAERDRTADLLIANEALSQLSYGPMFPRTGATMFTGDSLSSGACQAGPVKRRAGKPALPLPRSCHDGSLPITSARPLRPACRVARTGGLAGAAASDDAVIQIYIWVLIASAILSWLVAFDVVNRRNPDRRQGRAVPLSRDRTGAAADPSHPAVDRRRRSVAAGCDPAALVRPQPAV